MSSEYNGAGQRSLTVNKGFIHAAEVAKARNAIHMHDRSKVFNRLIPMSVAEHQQENLSQVASACVLTTSNGTLEASYLRNLLRSQSVCKGTSEKAVILSSHEAASWNCCNFQCKQKRVQTYAMLYC